MQISKPLHAIMFYTSLTTLGKERFKGNISGSRFHVLFNCGLVSFCSGVMRSSFSHVAYLLEVNCGAPCEGKQCKVRPLYVNCNFSVNYVVLALVGDNSFSAS